MRDESEHRGFGRNFPVNFNRNSNLQFVDSKNQAANFSNVNITTAADNSMTNIGLQWRYIWHQIRKIIGNFGCTNFLKSKFIRKEAAASDNLFPTLNSSLKVPFRNSK